jgi:hypothetical protein
MVAVERHKTLTATSTGYTTLHRWHRSLAQQMEPGRSGTRERPDVEVQVLPPAEIIAELAVSPFAGAGKHCTYSDK